MPFRPLRLLLAQVACLVRVACLAPICFLAPIGSLALIGSGPAAMAQSPATGAPQSALSATAQAADSADATQPGHGRILLLLPFDNQTNQANQTSQAANPSRPETTPSASEASEQANLDWVREAAPDILSSRLLSAGFLPLSRQDRLYALDHLGFPETFQPSRATTIRLAQTLDADSVLFGSFAASGSLITFHARVVNIPALGLSPEVSVSGEISQLIPLLNSLAWLLARQLDPTFPLAEETFRAAGASLRLDAFEQYIRGISERDPDERLRHLKRATELDPQFIAAWLATGRLQFEMQQFEDAAASFAHIPKGDPAELEADFYRGIAQLFAGSYSRGEDSFAAIARVLPLPEVVNNQGVAISRRGKDASALYRQASVADPNDPDYHFNLALGLHRQGDEAASLAELDRCLKQRPDDSEARSLADLWQDGKSPSTEPLERIKRVYDGAAYRQATLMLEQVQAARLALLPPAQQAASLNRSARESLDRGLLLEAERQFHQAMAADPKSADAHLGLALVRERSGDSAGARQQARQAIDAHPSADAWIVLTRLDLAANHLNQAEQDISEALRLDPQSRSAGDLRTAIANRISANPEADPKPDQKP